MTPCIPRADELAICFPLEEDIVVRKQVSESRDLQTAEMIQKAHPAQVKICSCQSLFTEQTEVRG